MNPIRLSLRFAVVFAFTAMLLLGFAVARPDAARGEIEAVPELSYTVSGCDLETYREAQLEVENSNPNSDPAKKFSIATEGNALKFVHRLSYVCCADLRLESKVEENAIAITEVNEGDYCRCMCDYSLEASLGPLASGTYDLKIYGVRYRSNSGQYEIPARLLLQTQVDVNAP